MNAKADINIGKRAAEFILEKSKEYDGSMKKTAAAIGIERRLYYQMLDGQTPRPLTLLKLVNAGADANYILTGKR